MTAEIDIRLCDGPVSDPVDSQASTSRVCGAVCTFAGCTRGETHPEHGDLLRLEYSAYESMAVGEMKRLAEEAAARWPLHAIEVTHSVGPVSVGEVSVLVRVFSAHRAEAFAACGYVIDELKARAPIWKREIWAKGESWQEGVAAGRKDSS